MDYPKHKILPDEQYYALTFTASESGEIFIDGQTMWVGFADEEKKIELREFSLVNAQGMADFWIKFGMPFCVVNDIDDYFNWYKTGGHALVTKNVANEMFPISLRPSSCVQVGNKGFINLGVLPESVFKKAPTPKKRMDVLKRDNYRCKICGERPGDNVHIVLNVHHIRPFSDGGITHEDNLIALCHTCHAGLNPHYEWSLYNLLNNTSSDIKTREQRKYFKGVENYRRARKNAIE